VARDDGSPDGVLEPGQEHHRASDADRERVADRLRHALDEGRLTVLEYDERLRAAYGSLTYGELAKVTSDLPAPAPSTPPERAADAAPARQRGRTKEYLVRQGRAWLGGAVVTNGIWAATSGLDWHHYWPGAVLGFWALGVVAKLVSGRHHEEEENDRERRLHHHRERIERHHGRLNHGPDRRSLPEPPERPE
jgi:Domain of unknown function (DUF1707)